MKKTLGRLTVGLVLVLSGCSVHFHGEAGSGSKSSETSGDERASNDKPKKNKRDKDKKDDKKNDRDDDDKVVKDDDKKDDDKKDDDKKDDDKKDDGKVADNDDKKPTPPKPVIPDSGGAVHGTGGTKPIIPDSGGAIHGTDGGKKPVIVDAGGAIHGTGGGTGGTTGGTAKDPGSKPGTNPDRANPDKGVAQGGRADTEETTDDDKAAKPDKSDTQGTRGGVAMQPVRTVPGLGKIRQPVAITGFECKLASATVKPGASLTIKGSGFDDTTAVRVAGSAIEVRTRTATKLVAKLPKELEVGGTVTLKQGDLVANCGKLEIAE